MMAAALGVLVSCGSVKSGEEVVAASRDSKVVVAYVTSWSEVMPDPQYMTHINYAFGHVNESFNGVKIDNEERLRQIVDLRKQKPELKVLLSIGGWGSGRFSEMAANDEYRRAFAADCARVVKEFALDGIDIDWEYPTSSMANISSSPDDTENFTLLMQDIRAAIGNEKELTLATVASARYIDFKAILPSVDFVNIMAYDMASAPKHHSALYPSGHSGDITSDGAVTAHLKAGVPPSKLVMGMPFYGRGGDGYPSFQDEDLQKASAIARNMVTRYGMSEKVGNVVFDSGHDEVFIGRSMAQTKNYSEEVAALIDEEVKALVDGAYARCGEILTHRRRELDIVAEYLLQYENMDAKTFEQVFTDPAALQPPAAYQAVEAEAEQDAREEEEHGVD